MTWQWDSKLKGDTVCSYGYTFSRVGYSCLSRFVVQARLFCKAVLCNKESMISLTTFMIYCFQPICRTLSNSRSTSPRHIPTSKHVVLERACDVTYLYLFGWITTTNPLYFESRENESGQSRFDNARTLLALKSLHMLPPRGCVWHINLNLA